MNRLTIGIDLAYAKPCWVASVVACDGEHERLFDTTNVPPQKTLLEMAYLVVDAIDAQYNHAVECDYVMPGERFVVVIEKPFVKFNIGVALKMGTLLGMIEATVSQTFGTTAEFYPIAPSQWQQAILMPAKGSDLKKLSKKIAKRHYGIKRRIGDDEADSINIARYGRLALTLGDDYPGTKKSAA